MKNAHAMMWQRWQEHIDFEALQKRHLELPVLPVEWRYEALFDAIGMLYGEYLTAHIDVTMDRYVQAVTPAKRQAQRSIVGLLDPNEPTREAGESASS